MSFDNKIALAAFYKSCGFSNAAIATFLRVDASSVSRYLTQAEREAWLRFSIGLHLPPELDQAVRATVRDQELEKRLFEFFNGCGARSHVRRESVVVVKTGMRKRHEGLYATMMSIEAARLLLDLLGRRDVGRPTILGTTWGRGTGGVVTALGGMSVPEMPELLVVPLQGGVGRTSSSDVSSHYYPNILAERLSLLFRSRQSPALITLPAYISASAAAHVGEGGLKAIWQFIEHDASFQQATAAHEKLDIALIGIGGFERNAWAVSSGYLADSAVVDALKSEGARGDIVCRFFRDGPEAPIEGWHSSSGVTETIRRTNLRAVGISLATLGSRVKAGARVLAVAGGQSGAKASAIRAAVINGFVTDLVTDDATALAIARPGGGAA